MGSDLGLRSAMTDQENASAPSDSDGLADHPDLLESTLVSDILNLFYRARAEKRKVVAQWYRNYEIMHNRTWGSSRPSHMPTPEVPEIYPIIASLIGWLTDTQPQMDVIPSADPYSDYVAFYNQLAADLKVVLNASWNIEQCDAQLEILLWDALNYGIGVGKSTWCDTLHDGLGNATFRRVDPFTFYPDPKARSFEDANYFIETRTMSLQDMDKRWPGSSDRIRSSGFQIDSDESPTITDNYGSGARGGQKPLANPGALPGATDSRYGLPGQTDRGMVSDDPGTTVFECWLRTPAHSGGAGSGPTDSRGGSRHYDTWRCIIVAANCILSDVMVEDMWEMNTHPYDRYVMHDTGEMYGYSMVELLTPSQLSINRNLASIEQNLWLVGNPVFKESPSGAMRTRIPNRPGARIQVQSANGVAEWLKPPPIPDNLIGELIRFYIDEMERISGLMAMNRGSSPGGRNAADVLASIQEAGFVRIRLAIRNLERFMREVGAKLASLIAENYDAPRMVAMIGPSGERTAMSLEAKHFYGPSTRGRVPMRFQLLVQAGSALPVSRQARSNEADVLRGMGSLDIEGHLEAHNWPNRREIVSRIRAENTAQGLPPDGLPPGSRAAAGH